MAKYRRGGIIAQFLIGSLALEFENERMPHLWLRWHVGYLLVFSLGFYAVCTINSWREKFKDFLFQRVTEVGLAPSRTAEAGDAMLMVMSFI